MHYTKTHDQVYVNTKPERMLSGKPNTKSRITIRDDAVVEFFSGVPSHNYTSTFTIPSVVLAQMLATQLQAEMLGNDQRLSSRKAMQAARRVRADHDG